MANELVQANGNNPNLISHVSASNHVWPWPSEGDGLLDVKAWSIDCVWTSLSLRRALYSYRFWRFFWISDMSAFEPPSSSANNGIMGEYEHV